MKLRTAFKIGFYTLGFICYIGILILLIMLAEHSTGMALGFMTVIGGLGKEYINWIKRKATRLPDEADE